MLTLTRFGEKMGFVGNLVFFLGLVMCIRGWIYTLQPEGAIARKRQQKNMRLGFTTDMRLFGRKIRRLGLFIAILGGFLAWPSWQPLINNL